MNKKEEQKLMKLLLNNKKGVILDEQYIFNTSKLEKEYANIWVFQYS